MHHIGISAIGGFLIWCLSGFKKKKIKEYTHHKFAFLAGFVFILLIVVILYNL